jgi:serine/threonine-protein kinase HipA
MLPEKIKLLEVSIAGQLKGQLLRQSRYEFRYLDADASQPPVGLLMPAQQLTYEDGDLFPVMDQHLPEGDLFMRLRQLFPKQALTAMHLLALVGANGIGRLGYALPGHAPAPNASVLSRQTLLETTFTPEVFDDLVSAYLSTGAGIAGMQPKIMVPDRPTISIPTLIVKAGSQAYPGLAANEFLCLRAAQRAGIQTPDFDLSYDGQLLLLDRFDIEPDGQRLGFEDIASLMGLRVRDTLADRKYHGSYQRIADVLKLLQLPEVNLHRFFEQVAFTIMVRNGDGHLKNYGVLYRTPKDIWLAPMFDVVTTSIYRYQRYGGGPELEDRTMALKLFSGKGQTRSYPDTAELLRFGRTVCGVERPGAVLEKIAQAMASVLDDARNDVRVPVATLAAMRDAWLIGMTYAAEAARTAVKHSA